MTPSTADRQYLIRTLLGEAAQQPDEGVAAVAHVINNRRNSGRWGNDIRSVVTAKSQFEPWGSTEGRKRMMSVKQDDPAYQRAARIADGVLSGNIPDPTGGADHFLNADIVRQRNGGNLPSWAESMWSSAHRIGDHTFLGGNGQTTMKGGEGGTWTEVTDPAILAQLNGDEGPAQGYTLEELLAEKARRNSQGSEYTLEELLAERERRRSEPEGSDYFDNYMKESDGDGWTEVTDPEILKQLNGAPPDASGEGSPFFDNFMSQGATPDVAPAKSASPAFDAFVSKHHPDISAEEKEAMRARMSNPARTGAAVADSFLPWSDEISAGIGAGIRTVGKAFTDEDMDFSGDYDAGLARMRAFQAAEDELQGSTDEAIGTLAAVGGGGATSLTKAGAKLLASPTATGRAIKAAGAGAAAGGVYGAGEGEGGIDRAKRAAVGAVTGGAGGLAGNAVAGVIARVGETLGPVIAKFLGRPGAITPDGQITPATRAQLARAGVDPDEVSAAFAQEFAKRSDLPPEQAARAATFDTLGVRGTRGQITGDVTDQASEEAMRAGVQGGQPAANVMRQFDETQRQGLNRARDEFGANLGGGNVIADDAVSASELAFQGVQRQAGEAKAAAQVFYKKADDAGVTIAPGAFDDLVTRLDDRLAAAEVIVDADTPVANRMMAMLKARSKRPEGAVGGVSLGLVDKTRSRISGALRDARRRGDTIEVEALSEMLSGVDEWTEDAVDRALLSGTPEALDALKSARSMWTHYRKTFYGKKGADKFIAKMVEDDAGPRDVFGWLYSNGRMGAGKQSTQFAGRLKDILGEDSSEWAALRQGAWAKLTKGVSKAEGPGAQKIGQDIAKFLSGDTRSLAQTLFSQNEIRDMFVYARGMAATVPQRKATNVSGSGYEARRAAGAAFRRLVEMFGFSQGGLEGAIAGGAGARALGTGGGWLRAKAATAGVLPNRSVVPGVAGGLLLGDNAKTAAGDYLGVR